MKQRAEIRLLPDGRRLYLRDGPIDIVLEAFGEKPQVQAAYDAAAGRFLTVLDELCEELPLLRSRVHAASKEPRGIVARRMFNAVLPYSEDHFITPMAAVAGSVAEEILLAMTRNADLERAYVNDGGDIALHIGKGQSFTIGMVSLANQPSLFGNLTLDHSSLVRGVATSGWRGRSFSLGIADAVTVIAKTAAMADAAATIVANAVDLPEHPAISRQPACELAPDTDLGDLPVTIAVGKLASHEVSRALHRGASCARLLISRGLMEATSLSLQGTTQLVCSDDTLCVAEDPDLRNLVHA